LSTRRLAAAALSPNGQLLAVAGLSEVIGLYNANTGIQLSAFERPLSQIGRIVSLAFSPDSRRLVSASADNTMRVWDVTSGSVLMGPVYLCKPSDVFGSERVAFLSDGRSIISFNWTELHIWDATQGTLIGGPFVHSSLVYAFAVSPDGKWLVSGSINGILVWKFQSGQEHVAPSRAFKKYKTTITSIVFSPDGRWVISGSEDGQVRFWYFETGMMAASFGLSDEDKKTFLGSSLQSVAISPRGDCVVATFNEMIYVWVT
jgi:WD40 repeat protein